VEPHITEHTRTDIEARNKIIVEYLPHVKRIVNRMAVNLPSSVENEELVNAGIIGLIQAIDRYDPSRDNKFMTYAVFRIKGAIISELRSRDFLGRSLRRKIKELDKAYFGLEQKLGREASAEELAEALNTDVDQVNKVRRMSNISFISFEEVEYASKNEKRSLIDYLNSNNLDDALAVTRIKEIKAAIEKAIEKLGKKEQLVLSLYYSDGLTMKETGKVLDITESRVSQIHSRAIIRLRGRLRNQGLLK